MSGDRLTIRFCTKCGSVFLVCRYTAEVEEYWNGLRNKREEAPMIYLKGKAHFTCLERGSTNITEIEISKEEWRELCFIKGIEKLKRAILESIYSGNFKCYHDKGFIL